MSTLRVEKYTMPAAKLGGPNPLPMLLPRISTTAGNDIAESVPDEDRKYFGYGLDSGWLPYRGQDDYNRSRSDRDFIAVVLENELLRATILPEVGGRLWSLVHRPTDRELLFVNKVFQPANLAVRGAWVAGGVEWNPCVYGHSPYNCSSLFAAEVEDARYGPILRLYEWDRARCIPYQIDFSLPTGSHFLLVRIRLDNPHRHTVPMYWWSNIAVAESPDVRVLVPADKSYTYEYWGRVHSASVPTHRDIDITYSTNSPYAADYFFRIRNGARPWIATLDRDGCGLVQTSTGRQVGRKLFMWGNKPGGRRWQEFLSVPNQSYFEIQAGLTRTQLECAPMPAGACWEWVEAYGLLQADSAKVHGSDWNAAINEVANKLSDKLEQNDLEKYLRDSREAADRKPSRLLHRGSGWGALERHRRERFREPPFCTNRLIFDDQSLGADQDPWLSLLYDGAMPDSDPAEAPGAWMIQREWRDLLLETVENGTDDHWLTQLHLGVMHYADDRLNEADAAWRRSLKQRPSGWAYRNLAVLRTLAGDIQKAASYYDRAYQLLPQLRPLLIEYFEALLAAARPDDVLRVIDKLPGHIRDDSRVRLCEARAGAKLGELHRCEPILRSDYELIDIREGETSLTDIWNALSNLNGDAADNGSAIKGLNGYNPPSGMPRRLDFRVMPHPRPCSPPQPHSRFSMQNERVERTGMTLP